MNCLRSGSSKVLGALCLIFIVSLSLPVPAAQAVEEGQAVTSILSKWGDAVVEVKAVIKLRVVVGGNEQAKEENENVSLATVIDPSGIAVLSFSSIDPTKVFGEIVKKQNGKDGPKMDMDSEITSLTMIMADGREIPAKVILRDADLDMAFIMPTEKPAKPMTAVDISGDGKAGVPDTVVILNRLDKNAGRAISVSLKRIEAVISNPRRSYVADSETLMNRLGAPVFSLDGKVVGFSLLRMTKSGDKSSRGGFLSSGISSLGIMPVILPVGEVSAAAKQAVAIKQ